MFDPVRPALSTAPLSTLTDELSVLAEAVADLARPAETTFLALGDVLVTSVQVLQGVDQAFGNLIGMLDSADADTARQALVDVMERSAMLVGRSSQITERLGRMETATAAALRPLADLVKIAGEIGALGVNARIQAAQIGSAGIDFSVFTTEILRLRVNAEAAIDKASTRFHGVRNTVGTVRAIEAELLATDLQEIQAAKTRFETALGTLDERHHRATTTAACIGDRFQAIATHVAACVSRMQIADRTSQRLDHVHQALRLLAAMAAGETCNHWDEDRKRALVAAACDLQARQFDQAIQEFAVEVECLRNDVIALAHDMSRIAADAGAVFGAEGEALFIKEVHTQVEHDMDVLHRYTGSRGKVQELVSQLISELNRMSSDMDAVQDIDAEMRVIGLNASFKCGRLGGKGRALSVIAQELRACSHRTEETSKFVVNAMKETVGTAEWLSAAVDGERAEAATLTESLSLSVTSLARLSDEISDHFTMVHQEWSRIATMLADAGTEIVVHTQTAATAGQLSTRLQELASQGDRMTVEYDLDADLLSLLGQHYTMESERAVHGSFSDGPADAASSDDSIEFF